MLIALPLETDSDSSSPTETLDLRRGSNRPDNCVIVIGERQIEVNMDDLKKAVAIL